MTLFIGLLDWKKRRLGQGTLGKGTDKRRFGFDFGRMRQGYQGKYCLR